MIKVFFIGSFINLFFTVIKSPKHKDYLFCFSLARISLELPNIFSLLLNIRHNRFSYDNKYGANVSIRNYASVYLQGSTLKRRYM